MPKRKPLPPSLLLDPLPDVTASKPSFPKRKSVPARETAPGAADEILVIEAPHDSEPDSPVVTRDRVAVTEKDDRYSSVPDRSLPENAPPSDPGSDRTSRPLEEASDERVSGPDDTSSIEGSGLLAIGL
jgi:hypothetical protein